MSTFNIRILTIMTSNARHHCHPLLLASADCIIQLGVKMRPLSFAGGPQKAL